MNGGLAPSCTRQHARLRDAPECRSRNGSTPPSATAQPHPNPHRARSPAPRCAAPAPPTPSPRSTPAPNRPAPPPRLSDTVAKLNARLEQLTSGRSAPSESGRSAAPEPKSPPLAPDPLGIEQAVAEIAARQRALDEAPTAPAAVFQPVHAAPAAAPAPAFPNLHPPLPP